VLWSLFAVAVTAVAIFPALHFAQPALGRFFGTENVDLVGFYRANMLSIFGLQATGIVAMTLFTTKMATAKYLKV
jgi:hypothetical protein